MNRITIITDRRSLLWSLAIIAGTAGFLWFVTRSQASHMTALQAAIEQEREELADGQKSPQSIARLGEEVDALGAKTENFKARIPADSELGEFLQKLSQAAETHGLRPDSIKPGDPEVYAEITALPIAMRVRGPFTAVFALIKELEAMPRLSQIDRLTTVSDEGAGGVVSVELDFKIFFLAGKRES